MSRIRYPWRRETQPDDATLAQLGLGRGQFFFAWHEYARLLDAGATEAEALEHARAAVPPVPVPCLTDEQLAYVRHHYGVARARAQRLADVVGGSPPRPADDAPCGAGPTSELPAEGDVSTVREGCDSEAGCSAGGDLDALAQPTP